MPAPETTDSLFFTVGPLGKYVKSESLGLGVRLQFTRGDNMPDASWARLPGLENKIPGPADQSCVSCVCFFLM